MVVGYFFKGFHFPANPSINIDCEQLYNVFYGKIEKYFECDRKLLENQYHTVDFCKHFEIVEEHDVIDEFESNIFSLKKYLKTMSAYNTYMEKGEEDPVDVLEEEFKELLGKHSIEVEKVEETEVLLRNNVFWKIMRKRGE